MKSISILALSIFTGISCSWGQLNDNFSSALPWTLVYSLPSYQNPNCSGYSYPQVSVNSGVFNFNSARCQVQNRLYRPLATALSNDSWIAEFDYNFIFNGTDPSIRPGSTLLALTAGNGDPHATYAVNCPVPGNFTTTMQDGFIVEHNLKNQNLPISSSNPALVTVRVKDGQSTISDVTQGITLNTGGIYKVRVRRLSSSAGDLSILNSQGQHIPGSPWCFSIPRTITGVTGITHAQLGVVTWGQNIRKNSGTIDNLVVQNYAPVISVPNPVCTMCGTYVNTIYSITVSNIPGVTYSNASWSYPPSSMFVLHSIVNGPGYTTINFRIPCNMSGQIITLICTPNLGNGANCGYDIPISFPVYSCSDGGGGDPTRHAEHSGNPDERVLVLYPSPNHGNFTVELPEVISENSSLEIMDSFGRIVEVVKVSAGTDRIQILRPDISPGVYVCSLKQNGTIREVIKFMICH